MPKPSLIEGSPGRFFAATISKLKCRSPDEINPNLPNITILATGGTIANPAASNDTNPNYLPVETLIKAVPQLWDVCNPKGIQVVNVPSSYINTTVLLKLSRAVQAELDNPGVQGVVVTHGTDTLEETAFFLDLAVKTDKPLIVVGSIESVMIPLAPALTACSTQADSSGGNPLPSQV